MASLFHRFNDEIQKFVGNVIGNIVGVERGTFDVQHGSHEIVMPTKRHVNKLWITIKEKHAGEGCGQAHVNKVGYLCGRRDIMFFVDVASEHCKISWFATD